MHLKGQTFEEILSLKTQTYAAPETSVSIWQSAVYKNSEDMNFYLHS